MCLHAQYQSKEGWSEADVYLKASNLIGGGRGNPHLSITSLAGD